MHGSSIVPAPTGRLKPALRGVSHLVAFVVTPVASVWLIREAPDRRAALAAAVYVASLAVLFGASALYHVPTWPPRARERLRRLDHGAIFFLIGGTYTPFCLLALPHRRGLLLLGLVLVGSAAGVLQALLWIRAPRPVTIAIYLLLGWACVSSLPQLLGSLGAGGLALLCMGGALYTVGAVIYAARRPDPLPSIFGYHEIFHALVIAAAICHFLAVRAVVARS